MASTTVAIGKIEVQRRKEEPIPLGWALDKNGNQTTDAAEAFDASLLLPLGGVEVTSGYKGIFSHFWRLDLLISWYDDINTCYQSHLAIVKCFKINQILFIISQGYGLATLVEILTGISSGASFATKVRRWALDGSSNEEANLGQVYIAVDPNCFAPGFETRMTDLNGILRNLPPVRRVFLQSFMIIRS